MPKKKEVKTLIKRAPIVTIMGHVDHGKTSILDALRKTNIVAKEHGGITQHIGASQIFYKGNKITFIDTPGHEAFSQMRARGGNVADIIILVVAANDGVMPQTKEAIGHALSSKCKIIVAINKIDLPEADIKKVKRELSENGIMVEGYGGDVVAVPVSAKSGKNINDLLDAILLVSEMENLQTDPKAPLKAVVIESFLDKRKGPLVNILVQEGVLKTGDTIYSGEIVCKVKALTDSKGQMVTSASSSDPVQIMGFKTLPLVGSLISFSKETRKEEKELVIEEKAKLAGGQSLNIILKADVAGSLEAIKSSLLKVHWENVDINLIYSGVGNVNQSDVLLADSSKAIIIAFNVAVLDEVDFLARSNKVIIRKYSIIYKLLEELQGAVEGLFEIEEEKIKGRAEVVAVFHLPSGDVISGSSVFAGQFKVGDKVWIWENEGDLKEHLKAPRESLKKPIFETKIHKIKLEKDFVEKAPAIKNYGFLFNPQFKEVQKGYIIDRR